MPLRHSVPPDCLELTYFRQLCSDFSVLTSFLRCFAQTPYLSPYLRCSDDLSLDTNWLGRSDFDAFLGRSRRALLKFAIMGCFGFRWLQPMSEHQWLEQTSRNCPYSSCLARLRWIRSQAVARWRLICGLEPRCKTPERDALRL